MHDSLLFIRSDILGNICPGNNRADGIPHSITTRDEVNHFVSVPQTPDPYLIGRHLAANGVVSSKQHACCVLLIVLQVSHCWRRCPRMSSMISQITDGAVAQIFTQHWGLSGLSINGIPMRSTEKGTLDGVTTLTYSLPDQYD